MMLRRLSRLSLVGVLLILAVTAVLAQDADEIPTVSIIADKDGVQLPETFSAGLVTIIFENKNAETPFSPVIARLKEGKTMDDFTTLMQGQANPAEVLEVVDLLGGAETPAESSSEITYDLAAGDYIFLNFAAGGPPDVRPFTVAESTAEPLEAPQADQVVTLVDFAISIPPELKAGEQVWEIVHDGKQFHEAHVLRVDDGATIQDVTKKLTEAFEAAAAAQAGPPQYPYETAAFFTPISGGLKAWMKVDLEPGTYAIICSLPDFSAEGGPPVSHLAHGMIAIFTVTE